MLLKKISAKISDIFLNIILSLIYFIGFGLYYIVIKFKNIIKPTRDSYWNASTATADDGTENLKRQA